MNINYSQSNINFKKGMVILGSAGPGSLDLISLKLRYVLKKADVVIFDALVNKKILNFCKKTVNLIYAGKLKEKKSCTQDEINQWLVNFAKANKKVLRLKGGDISFFSRGSQEINCLRENGISFKIFSGITSSQTSINSSVESFFNSSGICNLITGHRRINSNFEKNINYNFLKVSNGRIIIYMGVSQIRNISLNLIKSGINRNETVTLITNSSLNSQKIYTTSLIKCPDFILENNIKSPSIIIIK
tara:strand:+ start:272 stop:1009 length:738 start_codon:yes stop_codon:yes gene_type:complete